jgi:hypothetical protein
MPTIAGRSSDTVKFKADLSASNEVPPNPSAGREPWTQPATPPPRRQSYLHGRLLRIDRSGDGGSLTLPAAAGVNDAAPARKPNQRVRPQAPALAGGKWYFNIHIDANKAGEIRGQVIK